MGVIVSATVALTILEKQRLGYISLSLSNFTTSGIPQIIGNVEVAGALYTFNTLETINNWAGVGAGAVWVKLVPEIDGDITAEWTDVAPAWSEEKQGYYSPTLGEENQRYVFSATKVDASNVTGKRRIDSLASVTEVDNEAAARVAGDAAVQAAVDAIEPTTSSDGSLLDFPIGTILLVVTNGYLNRNAVIVPKLNSNGSQYGYDNFGLGTNLLGTWRTRGGIFYDGWTDLNTYAYLAQRVG